MRKWIYCFVAMVLWGASVDAQSGKVEVYSGNGAVYGAQRVLDLSNQDLTKVPIKAFNKEIETLILDNNHIKKLPLWLADLKKLRVLSVRNNQLTEIGFDISSCIQLRQLYLSGNKELTDISDIYSRQKLELIDVVDTQINELPGFVRMMDSLYYFKYTKK